MSTYTVGYDFAWQIAVLLPASREINDTITRVKLQKNLPPRREQKHWKQLLLTIKQGSVHVVGQSVQKPNNHSGIYSGI